LIRLQALKLLGFFLSRSTHKWVAQSLILHLQQSPSYRNTVVCFKCTFMFISSSLMSNSMVHGFPWRVNIYLAGQQILFLYRTQRFVIMFRKSTSGPCSK
jgi:hypothetical protein